MGPRRRQAVAARRRLPGSGSGPVVICRRSGCQARLVRLSACWLSRCRQPPSSWSPAAAQAGCRRYLPSRRRVVVVRPGQVVWSTPGLPSGRQAPWLSSGQLRLCPRQALPLFSFAGWLLSRLLPFAAVLHSRIAVAGFVPPPPAGNIFSSPPSAAVAISPPLIQPCYSSIYLPFIFPFWPGARRQPARPGAASRPAVSVLLAVRPGLSGQPSSGRQALCAAFFRSPFGPFQRRCRQR